MIDRKAADHLIGQLYGNKVAPRRLLPTLFDEFMQRSEIMVRRRECSMRPHAC